MSLPGVWSVGFEVDRAMPLDEETKKQQRTHQDKPGPAQMYNMRSLRSCSNEKRSIDPMLGAKKRRFRCLLQEVGDAIVLPHSRAALARR